MVRQIALNIDVAPTIADLAGVAPTPSPDGISLVPLLGDAGVPTRDRFVVEFLGFAPNVPPYSALRTERYLYVEYRDGSRELYDLRADPFQLRNMLGEGGRAPPELVTELSGSLEALLAG
jgi:arylsulfatase A-like enzyme